MYLSEGNDVFRIVAMHNAPPAFAEMRRRNPVFRADPRIAMARAAATRQPVQIADVQAEPGYLDSLPGLSGSQIAALAGGRTVLAVPLLKESKLVRRQTRRRPMHPRRVGEGQAGTSALLKAFAIHASYRGRHRKARHQLESACALRFLEGEEMLQSLTSDTAPQRSETWLRADLLFLRDALARGMCSGRSAEAELSCFPSDRAA
jgi:hypothetical protein